MALKPPNNKPGAQLWDTAVQGGPQTAGAGKIPLIPGGPEGVIYGDPGTVCSDETGKVYAKTTDNTVATGWTRQTATLAQLATS